MYGVDYEDKIIVEISEFNCMHYDESDRIETFEKAKEALISYWEDVLQNAKVSIKECKNITKENIY